MRIVRCAMFCIAGLVGIGLSTSALASFQVQPKSNFTVHWYFHNQATDYTDFVGEYGYFRDYDHDGLGDYFVALENPNTHDWRLFTLKTAANGAEKTYSADKTAGVDIAAIPLAFVPKFLEVPAAPAQSYPDVVVVGTNADATGTTYTQFLVHRYDTTSTVWITNGAWLHNVDSRYHPQFTWLTTSLDADDYPDYLVYNMLPDAAGQYVISAYNGQDGSLIWSRTLQADPDDSGLGFAAFDSISRLVVYQLRVAGATSGGNGDLDSDGKGDLLVYNAFSHGAYPTSYTASVNINILSAATGDAIAPYSVGSWTRVLDLPYALSAPYPTTTNADYSGDGYTDIVISNATGNGTPPPPVFIGYDLINQAQMFQSDVNDFGTGANDTWGYFAQPDYKIQSGTHSFGDLNGDGAIDLAITRMAVTTGQPMRVGMFNAYAAAAGDRGRAMFPLVEFANYGFSDWNVNDFDGDYVLDGLLSSPPTAPNAVHAGQATWQLAEVLASGTGIPIRREFEYSPVHTLTWDAATDSFRATQPICMGSFDADGDSLVDTLLSVSCTVDQGDDGTIDQGRGFVVVYDNSPGSGQPDVSAELEVLVDGEDWHPYCVPLPAMTLGMRASVDANGDGKANDLVITSERAVVCASYPGGGGGGTTSVYKVTYRNCLAYNSSGNLQVFDGTPGSSVKIQAVKNPPADLSSGNGFLYMETNRIPLVAISGDMGNFYSDAPIDLLRADGTLYSVTTKNATIGVVKAAAFGRVTMTDSPNSTGGSPLFAATQILSTGGSVPSNVRSATLTLSGVTLTTASLPLQAATVKVASKKYSSKATGVYASLADCGNVTAGTMLSVAVQGGNVIGHIVASGTVNTLSSKSSTLNGHAYGGHIGAPADFTAFATPAERMAMDLADYSVWVAGLASGSPAAPRASRPAAAIGKVSATYGIMAYFAAGYTGGTPAQPDEPTFGGGIASLSTQDRNGAGIWGILCTSQPASTIKVKGDTRAVTTGHLRVFNNTTDFNNR